MEKNLPKEKLLILKIRKNFEKINQNSLDFLKNQKLRINKREKQIEYLDSLFKPTPLPISIMSNEVIKSSLNNHFSINNEIGLNNQFYHTKDTFYKTTHSKFNFPRINTSPNKNNLNTYERMKNYKVILKKRKSLLPEEKIKRFIRQSGFAYIPIKKIEEKKINKNEVGEINLDEKNNININDNNDKDKKNKNEKNNNIEKKNTFKNKNSGKINLKNDKNNNTFIEDIMNSNRTKNQIDDNKKELNKKIKNKKMDFEYYLKMQSKAEIILKPKIGDNSNDLVNYINAIQGIRENLIIDILSEINKAENRYNKEKPEVDANFNVRDKGLNIHKWKNIFLLRDYQKYFLDGLKGKISNNNYKQMQKKFIQIQNVCFSEGKRHFQSIKNINFSE